MIAARFPTPYFAVVFTSLRTPDEGRAYATAAQRMVELARQQPGFLGVESARGDDGLGVTVSY
ncbi:antibiotic biosynthesis monooxygenase, partial [Pseudomonas syringae]|uniref:antibiotic biosynthesis monooxygenase family protein n=2 Tax=Pseudomonas TaxID=286 RepID=UPI001F8A3773|nr:antibiotic biosynthesis monooxygenase [Pseudomonas syringae]